MNNYEKLTQQYSTFGDKLLQHTDVLYSIQNNKEFKPITVQLIPTEKCDLQCNYCSVKNRNKKLEMKFDTIQSGLLKFKNLGAKSVEISGGGNPLLHPQINEIIEYAYSLNYKIGIITNSCSPMKYLTNSSVKNIQWIRISLSGLDINQEYNLDNIPTEKLGLSYIINEKTTEDIIQKIAKLTSYYNVKFTRIAPDCLNDAALTIKKDWDETIDKYNNGKIFIKEINDNFYPYKEGCYIGLLRPYWLTDGIYICSSHVLKTQNYDKKFKLCDIEYVEEFYKECNDRLKNGKSPYKINIDDCYHCYYHNNNKLLHSVITELPDKDFA